MIIRPVILTVFRQPKVPIMANIGPKYLITLHLQTISSKEKREIIPDLMHQSFSQSYK